MVKPVTVNDVLDGHVALDLECLDRVYLNAYVPNLQVGGQVVSFLTGHLGYPIPSPAVFDKIGTAFRRAVSRFADEEHIPVVRFTKTDRKIEKMRSYLAAQAQTGRSGVAAIGVAQEYANVFTGTQRDAPNGIPWFSFAKADRRVTCYYFYLWDDDFGPAFIKVCAYFPYPAKIWINGHEWAKRQATHAGIGFTELSNGFAATDDPAGLQAICDRLGPATIEAFAERWFLANVFRLSSKSHWDIPVRIGGKTVHFLTSHPTPPVFDGPEDRNGTRNHDEIRFWADYVTPGRGSRYIYDDDGHRGGLKPGASFVVAGDQNSDPLDGDSIPGSIQQLLEHPLVNARNAPSSEGAVEQNALQKGANLAHRSDPTFDTADFADTAPGNLRADYVLPRKNLRIRGSGVFWPLMSSPLFRLVGVFDPSLPGGFPSSDHRAVWVDLAVRGDDDDDDDD